MSLSSGQRRQEAAGALEDILCGQMEGKGNSIDNSRISVKALSPFRQAAVESVEKNLPDIPHYEHGVI